MKTIQTLPRNNKNEHAVKLSVKSITFHVRLRLSWWYRLAERERRIQEAKEKEERRRIAELKYGFEMLHASDIFQIIQLVTQGRKHGFQP